MWLSAARGVSFVNSIFLGSQAIAVEKPFTVIVDDPLANSYIQSLYAPDPDPGMTIELYDRTWDQNEELGLNDMKVEGYEEDAQDAEGEKKEEIIEP